MIANLKLRLAWTDREYVGVAILLSCGNRGRVYRHAPGTGRQGSIDYCPFGQVDFKAALAHLSPRRLGIVLQHVELGDRYLPVISLHAHDVRSTGHAVDLFGRVVYVQL